MKVKKTIDVDVDVSILSNGKLYIGIIDEKYGEHACCSLTKKQAEKLSVYIQLKFIEMKG